MPQRHNEAIAHTVHYRHQLQHLLAELRTQNHSELFEDPNLTGLQNIGSACCDMLYATASYTTPTNMAQAAFDAAGIAALNCLKWTMRELETWRWTGPLTLPPKSTS